MNVNLDRHLESTPNVRRGRPCLAGTRISVGDIVIMHLRQGQTLELIAGKYDVPLAGVFAAMAYYHDHKVDIDDDIRADEAYAESFRTTHPSLLEQKLESVARG